MRGLDLGVDVAQFAHQLIVDVQSAGRVQYHHIAAAGFGLINGGAADGHRRSLGHLSVRGGFGNVRINRHTNLLAEDAELLNGRRPLQIRRRQHRLMPLAHQKLRQLPASRRFPRALEAAHHNDGGAGLNKINRHKRS